MAMQKKLFYGIVFPEKNQSYLKWRSTNLYAYYNKRETCEIQIKRGIDVAKWNAQKECAIIRKKKVSRNKPLS